MDFLICIIAIAIIAFVINKFCRKQRVRQPPQDTVSRTNRLLETYGVRHINAIVDQFKSFEEVSQAIRKAGLESSNLIFGIDFTASNMYQGERTFDNRSLHSLDDDVENPYQQVIRSLGQTLQPFDDDDLIPAFGFGDITTKDKAVFPLCPEIYCNGMEGVLQAYNNVTPYTRLSGPTSFAPLIYRAIDIVKNTQQYHILVVIADGQVTSVGSTRDAIVAASAVALSIVVVGVGDGPWHDMRRFDDELPQRRFDNFQFVEYERVRTYGGLADITFALHALMEIPDQYAAIRRLGLLDERSYGKLKSS